MVEVKVVGDDGSKETMAQKKCVEKLFDGKKFVYLKLYECTYERAPK